jgi:hypothetical protein
MMKRDEPFTAPNIVIDVANLEDTLRALPEGNLVGLWETAAG